ncbi:MAG: hypothetical protein ACI9B8_002906, partial [Sulfitobacter sp.]
RHNVSAALVIYELAVRLCFDLNAARSLQKDCVLFGGCALEHSLI